MIGYHTQTAALGIYSKGADFVCAKTGGGNYVCKARTSPTEAVYRALQQTVKTIAAKMAAAGRLSVPRDLAVLTVDGDIGKITSIGVQFIGAAFSGVVPAPLAVTGAMAPGLTAEQAVERIAATAAEINAYFLEVLANFPDAIVAAPAKQKFPWWLIPVGIGVVGFFGVVIYFAGQPVDEFDSESLIDDEIVV